MTHRQTILSLAIAVLLTGCGGGGGGSSDGTPSVIASVTPSDGYLRGATVCFDTNKNNACDSGEPSTTSSTGTAPNAPVYSLDLSGLTADQRSSGRILVTGGTDDSTSAAFTGVLTTKFDASASASVNASPITTLLTAMVENDSTGNTTFTTAKTQLKTVLGITDEIDLATDPIANGGDLLIKAVALQKAMEVLAAAESTDNTDINAAHNRVAKAIAKAAETLSNNTIAKLIDGAVNTSGILDSNSTTKVNNTKALAQGVALDFEESLSTLKGSGSISATDLNTLVLKYQPIATSAKNLVKEKAANEVLTVIEAKNNLTLEQKNALNSDLGSKKLLNSDAYYQTTYTTTSETPSTTVKVSLPAGDYYVYVDQPVEASTLFSGFSVTNPDGNALIITQPTAMANGRWMKSDMTVTSQGEHTFTVNTSTPGPGWFGIVSKSSALFTQPSAGVLSTTVPSNGIILKEDQADRWSLKITETGTYAVSVIKAETGNAWESPGIQTVTFQGKQTESVDGSNTGTATQQIVVTSLIDSTNGDTAYIDVGKVPAIGGIGAYTIQVTKQ